MKATHTTTARPIWQRVLAFLVVLSFLPANPALPAYISTGKERVSVLKQFRGGSSGTGATQPISKDDLLNLTIPGAFGVIHERHEGADPRTIILCEDIHANYEAQSNFAKIMDFLQKGKTRGHINLIALEGAAGPVTPDVFGKMPEKEIRNMVADYFMQQGYLSGTDFFLVNAEDPVKVHGIETPELYRKNLQAYLKSRELREQLEPLIVSMQKVVSVLRPKVFTPELLAITDKEHAFEEGSVEFADYCKFLQDQVIASVTPLPRNDLMQAYPNFGLMMEVLRIEQGMDAEQVKEQRKKLVEELQAKLVKEEAADILAKTLYFRLGRVNASEYYNLLSERAKKAGVDIAGMKDLIQHMEKMKIFEKIDMDALMEEARKITADCKAKLYTNPQQKQLDELSLHLLILRRLVNLALTREEFQYLKEHRDEFDGGKYLALLKRLIANNGLPITTDPEWGNVTQQMDQMEQFYELALTRDTILFENTLKAMESERKQIAMVVVGGFHAQGIAKRLKEKGISYLFITSKITQKATDDLYIARMTNQTLPILEYLTRRASRLAIANFLGNVSELNPEASEAQQSFRNLASALYSLLASAQTGTIDATRLRRELRIAGVSDVRITQGENGAVVLQMGDGPSVALNLNPAAVSAADLIQKIQVGGREIAFARAATSAETVAKVDAIPAGSSRMEVADAGTQAQALRMQARQHDAALAAIAEVAGSLASMADDADFSTEDLQGALEPMLLEKRRRGVGAATPQSWVIGTPLIASLLSRLYSVTLNLNAASELDTDRFTVKDGRTLLRLLEQHLQDAASPLTMEQVGAIQSLISAMRVETGRMNEGRVTAQATPAMPAQAAVEASRQGPLAHLSASVFRKAPMERGAFARVLSLVGGVIGITQKHTGKDISAETKAELSAKFANPKAGDLRTPQELSAAERQDAKSLKDFIAGLLSQKTDQLSKTLAMMGLTIEDLDQLQDIAQAMEEGRAPPTLKIKVGDQEVEVPLQLFVSQGQLHSETNAYTDIQDNQVRIALSEGQLASNLPHEVLEVMLLVKMRASKAYQKGDAHAREMLERSAHTKITLLENLFEGQAVDGSLNPRIQEQIKNASLEEIKALVQGTVAAIGEIKEKIKLGGLNAQAGQAAINRSHRVLAAALSKLPADERADYVAAVIDSMATAGFGVEAKAALDLLVAENILSPEQAVPIAGTIGKGLSSRVTWMSMTSLEDMKTELDAHLPLKGTERGAFNQALKNKDFDWMRKRLSRLRQEGARGDMKNFLARTFAPVFGEHAPEEINRAMPRMDGIDADTYQMIQDILDICLNKELSGHLSAQDRMLLVRGLFEAIGLAKTVKIGYHNIHHFLEVTKQTAQRMAGMMQHPQVQAQIAAARRALGDKAVNAHISQALLTGVLAAANHDIGYAILEPGTEKSLKQRFIAKLKAIKGAFYNYFFDETKSEGQFTTSHVYRGPQLIKDQMIKMIGKEAFDAMNGMITYTDLFPTPAALQEAEAGIASNALVSNGQPVLNLFDLFKGALHNADLGSQMQSEVYVKKTAEALYSEFEEGGAARLWSSLLQLVAETTGFNNFVAKPRLSKYPLAEEALGIFLKNRGENPNQYNQNLDTSMDVIQLVGAIYGKLRNGETPSAVDMALLESLRDTFEIPGQMVDILRLYTKARSEGLTAKEQEYLRNVFTQKREVRLVSEHDRSTLAQPVVVNSEKEQNYGDDARMILLLDLARQNQGKLNWTKDVGPWVHNYREEYKDRKDNLHFSKVGLLTLFSKDMFSLLTDAVDRAQYADFLLSYLQERLTEGANFSGKFTNAEGTVLLQSVAAIEALGMPGLTARARILAALHRALPPADPGVKGLSKEEKDAVVALGQAAMTGKVNVDQAVADIRAVLAAKPAVAAKPVPTAPAPVRAVPTTLSAVQLPDYLPETVRQGLANTTALRGATEIVVERKAAGSMDSGYLLTFQQDGVKKQLFLLVPGEQSLAGYPEGDDRSLWQVKLGNMVTLLDTLNSFVAIGGTLGPQAEALQHYLNQVDQLNNITMMGPANKANFLLTPYLEGQSLAEEMELHVTQEERGPALQINDERKAYEANREQFGALWDVIVGTGGKIIPGDLKPDNIRGNKKTGGVKVLFDLGFMDILDVPGQEKRLTGERLKFVMEWFLRPEKSQIISSDAGATAAPGHYYRPIYLNSAAELAVNEPSMNAFLDAMMERVGIGAATELSKALQNDRGIRGDSALALFRKALADRIEFRLVAGRQAFEMPEIPQLLATMASGSVVRDGPLAATLKQKSDQTRAKVGADIFNHYAGMPGTVVRDRDEVASALQHAATNTPNVPAAAFAAHQAFVDQNKEGFGQALQAAMDKGDNFLRENKDTILNAIDAVAQVFENDVNNADGADITLNGNTAKMHFVSREEIFQATGVQSNAYFLNGRMYVATDLLQVPPSVLFQTLMHETLEALAGFSHSRSALYEPLFNRHAAQRAPGLASDRMKTDMHRAGPSHAALLRQGTGRKVEGEVAKKLSEGALNQYQADLALALSRDLDAYAENYQSLFNELTSQLAERVPELLNIFGRVAAEGQLDNAEYAKGIAALLAKSPEMVFRLAALRGSSSEMQALITNLNLPAELKQDWNARIEALAAQDRKITAGEILDTSLPAGEAGVAIRQMLVQRLGLDSKATADQIAAALASNPGSVHGEVMAVLLTALDMRKAIDENLPAMVQVKAQVQMLNEGRLSDIPETQGFVQDAGVLVEFNDAAKRWEPRKAFPVGKIADALRANRMVFAIPPQSGLTVEAFIAALQQSPELAGLISNQLVVSSEDIKGFRPESSPLVAARDAGLQKLRALNEGKQEINSVTIIVAKDNAALWESAQPVLYGILHANGRVAVGATVLNAAATLLGAEAAKALRESVHRDSLQADFVINLLEQPDLDVSNIQKMRAAAEKAA